MAEAYSSSFLKLRAIEKPSRGSSRRRMASTSSRLPKHSVSMPSKPVTERSCASWSHRPPATPDWCRCAQIELATSLSTEQLATLSGRRCRARAQVTSPRREEIDMEKVQKTEEDWRQQLTPEQFQVLRQAGTEAPFSGVLNDSKDPGIFRCAGC